MTEVPREIEWFRVIAGAETQVRHLLTTRRSCHLEGRRTLARKYFEYNMNRNRSREGGAKEMATGGESEGKKRRINADEDEEMPEASAAAAPRPLPAPPSAAHEQFSPELLRL
jgi:hypothetical protein